MKYAPTTALRGKRRMMSVPPPSPPSPTISSKDASKCLAKWWTRMVQLKRDFKEGLSSKMGSAILVDMLPAVMQDSVFATAERFDDDAVAREKITT